MRERQYDRYGQHRCHRSDQGFVGKIDALEGNLRVAKLQVAKELPRSLLTLVKKLDAVEGNLLLRRIQEAPAGRRKTPTAN